MTFIPRFTPSKNSVSLLILNFSIIFVLLFAPLFIVPSAAQSVSSTSDEIESILYKHGEVIVRVNFDDINEARNFGLGLEPMESDYQKGYLVFHLTKEEYQHLSSHLGATGMTMALDQALTRQFITHFTPRTQLSSAQDSSQRQISQMMTSAFDVSNYATIPGFACYRTVEGTFQTAQDIVTAYPNLATWTDQGNSWEKVTPGGSPGYDLMVLKLTNSAITGPKPKVFFTSSIHAREYTTAELMTRFAAKLVEEYGTDADTTWVLDHHEVHLMLSTNPDGRKQAETGLLWRKNTNENYCSPTSNLRGADLNRNFEFEWDCCGGSSNDQCNQTYHGSGPASEPEAQAVINYLRANFPDTRGPGSNDAADLNTMGLYIDVHSSGRLILWPWGSTSNPAPNSTQLQTLGRKLAFFNGHEPKQSIGLYPTDGTTTSFAYGDLGLPAYTYELGTQFFENCSYFDNTLLPDNIPSLAYLIKTARQPYVLPAGPDVINQNLSPTTPTGVPAGTQVTVTVTATDERFNNTNGTEPSQTVVSAEYYLDSPPWAVSPPASNPMSLVDGSANSSSEEFDAVIDTSGFSQGRHTLYIRATDQSGSTGVVSAVFLDIDNSAVIPVTIYSDNFETNQGWQTNPSGTDTATTGQWERANPQDTSANGGAQQLGTTVSGSFDLVTGPLAGTSAGTHDIDNGVTSIRSPAINLPVSSSITLSFQSYMAHLDNATTDDFFRASIIDGSGATVVFEELGEGNQDNGSWQPTSIDITAFAGSTINIQFEAADATTPSLVEAGVDDVEIIAVLSNQPPSVTSPGNQSSVESTAVNLPVVASDPENDPLTYSANLPAGLSINASTGVISGTLTAVPGVYASSVTVADDQGNDTTVNFDWTVTLDNDAPQINNPGNQTSDEGDTVSLIITATDGDNDPLTFSEVSSSLPPGLAINATTGEITGTLDFDSADTYTVEISVTDGNASDSAVFTWTVNNVNRAPVFDQQIPDQSDSEGDSSNLSATASDPDTNDTLTYSAQNLPDGITINSSTGVISGTLSATSAGNYSVDVTVSDGNLSAMQSFNWTVADVNLPPTITNPGNQSDPESSSVSLQISANDPESASLTYSDPGNSLPNGLSINSSSGLISGTLNAAVGSYTVTIQVSDGTNQVSTTFDWTVTQTGGSAQLIYLSSTSGGNVGGVTFADEDILTFNTVTNSWQMYIDGSDVGLSGSGSRDINAFTLMADGSIIFSTIGATTIPDVGSIDDSDLVRFIPTSTGTSTSGTFELYFDGSDVGLTTNGEDIDGVNLLANGDLLISTIGSHGVPGGISGQDEDLLLFSPTNLGASTSGSWSRYFDGSDVALNTSGTEDVYATWLDQQNGDIYLSTRSTFEVTGVSGTGADIFVCSPGSIGATTTCTFSLFWDGSTFGYGSESIDGLYIE